MPLPVPWRNWRITNKVTTTKPRAPRPWNFSARAGICETLRTNLTNGLHLHRTIRGRGALVDLRYSPLAAAGRGRAGMVEGVHYPFVRGRGARRLLRILHGIQRGEQAYRRLSDSGRDFKSR